MAYTEYGSVALTEGQTEVEITFTYEKTSSAYVFEYLYVKCSDTIPDAIVPVPNSQTVHGFVVKLPGSPTTVNSVLYWRVRIPDAFQQCQTATGGPHYAIVPVPQEGTQPLVVGVPIISVTFEKEQPDNNWVFESLTIENRTDPSSPSQIFSWTVFSHTPTGFILDLSGQAEVEGYVLRWKIA